MKRWRWEPQHVEGTDIEIVDLIIKPCTHCDNKMMATAVYRVAGVEWVDNPTCYKHEGNSWVFNMKTEGQPDRLLVADVGGEVVWLKPLDEGTQFV